MELGKVKPSYTPGYELGSIEDILPDYIVSSLKEGLPIIDKKLRGFADPDAILTGIETRSSSPVQVSRNESMESNISGLYMIGEGAGFSGGIVTSAVEGIKVANVVIDQYGV